MLLQRNSCKSGIWLLQKIKDHSICSSFDCGDDDLNDYFHNESIPHKEQLIAQSYCLQSSTQLGVPVALLDFCNDSISFKDYRSFITNADVKKYPSLPAVKLTRFGVNQPFQQHGVGTHLLNMVKALFMTDNRTGCRWITVDAYSHVVGFYEKNGFELMTDKDKDNKIRAMAFDLKRFSPPPNFKFDIG
ncbi:hypothetical protein ASJ33_05690 [Dehalococcoides mccartyi]|jgi:GNAT superfamily N-acetyltransferase|nr:hypothetical protein X792_05135 [Dehalococcoides mccartyi CG1]APH12681.1 hypothetical protein ASJ33_05690 [Dehalococcoides mccartyi]